ncbi:MAG: hypothetical protein DRJ41_03835 [Thermoprotei archaeon]|nr:MAG: hypothetical protein DRJ41_03835 [Thermoprotei archaeon]
MSDFEHLVQELKARLAEKGSLDLSELRAWAKEKELTPLTLFLIVEKMIEGKDVRSSTDKELIDEDLKLYVPKKIELIHKDKDVSLLDPYIKERKTKTLAKKNKAKKRRKVAPASQSSLISFLTTKSRGPKDVKREREKPVVGARQETQIVTSPKREEKKSSSELLKEEIKSELLNDVDIAKAISYLSKYWSVGEVRFVQDLKKLGVKNPKKVIETLIREGLVTRTRLGTLNAEERLFKVFKPKSLSLTDII